MFKIGLNMPLFTGVGRTLMATTTTSGKAVSCKSDST